MPLAIPAEVCSLRPHVNRTSCRTADSGVPRQLPDEVVVGGRGAARENPRVRQCEGAGAHGGEVAAVVPVLADPREHPAGERLRRGPVRPGPPPGHQDEVPGIQVGPLRRGAQPQALVRGGGRALGHVPDVITGADVGGVDEDLGGPGHVHEVHLLGQHDQDTAGGSHGVSLPPPGRRW